MLDKIILFSIKNKLLVGLFTLALISWGVYSATKLPIDAVPDITDNQVMVITVTPSYAAQEVERLITFPVEQTMASIPGIKEVRSFSRFGLSLVTIVFNDDVDIYWGRQQINERLGDAAKQIPEGVGTPEMAPVTTGLGEIYQYVIRPKPGFEDKYDAMALRTIQDWTIKRQLLGTPGVAEVSGFGGYVKQYEIAVNPDRMHSMDITITEIFDALQKNNQNTGGAYIDKKPNAYFIRSEGLVASIQDIEKIVVKATDKGVPILIRDVAQVQFGNSVRYGAATRNGKGEIVTGIVMMLKGANSSEVIKAVKEKIEQVKKTLPEGVQIEPFLDRKKLVDNAIGTVETNLIEGALIVIFILILFLGNLRAGLVVASVIPLSMLFAISMMNLFGVSGNLMSLGAIDFGLIVDGAVIIVESVLHGLMYFRQKNNAALTQAQMDKAVHGSASKMMNSAVFGQIIILIVYLPILALVGIEGKMFKPMAQAVMFAILGAFLLSLTYVPMISALFLSKKLSHKRNFSDRMMDFFQRRYQPLIGAAIRHKLIVIGVAVGLFLLSLFAFTRMGGEFIPQLDEGDFAVETRVLLGSSISEIIEASTKAQKIILKEFPDEVLQVVNKIGSGEIPTDPMPIEAGDMMIILREKKDWVKAKTREELAEKMGEKLSVIPGVTFGFQQPIQMRFNELITGAKQDVVLKIYGDDLDVLQSQATKVSTQIKGVDGVEDLYVEEITGLPQIQIQYNRDRIAQYGLNIEDINRVIKTAFAGESAGTVYEGEKRFDLVVRVDKASRAGLQDVSDLYLSTPRGEQIPLNEVATVAFKSGPNQIQRDNTKRRITIGFNVRNRDVESIVKDIQNIVDTKVKFPPGYFVTYGGQFENLKAAQQRLAIAVPVSLFLILLLLYFTFNSIKQSLLIFSAIPLSAIGGIFALLIRGMPFSISAGVGFIALFGVAVLNGIVLIAEFNRLKKEGMTDINERVLTGTKLRLRPVLMTAAVASLGFLPMALSNSSGAEVQRPLATVVIGGLISATFLTLVVLPVLYILFEKRGSKGGVKNKPAINLTALFFMLMSIALLPLSSSAQLSDTSLPSVTPISLQDALNTAVTRNLSVRSASYETALQTALRSGVRNFDKTAIILTQGQINSPNWDNHLSITQRIEHPSVYKAGVKLADARIAGSEAQLTVRQAEVRRAVRQVWYHLVYLQEKRSLLHTQDTLYNNLLRASAARYRTGESTLLEKTTSETQSLEIKNHLLQNSLDISMAQSQLQTLLQSSEQFGVPDTATLKTEVTFYGDSAALAQTPLLRFFQQQIEISQRETYLQKARRLPEFIAGYFNQSFRGTMNVNGREEKFGATNRFHGLQLGIAIPILPSDNRAKVAAARINEQIATTNYQLQQADLQSRLQGLAFQYQKYKSSVTYYQSSALPQADLIIRNADRAFKSGDITYIQFQQSLTLALKIKTDYLEAANNLNATILLIENILGN